MDPVVHVNGTLRDELVRLRCDAADALRVALEAFARMAPNRRDYYPAGDSTWAAALEQHENWRRTVSNVLDEITAQTERIADARSL